jgi:hypothetical protein
MIAIFLGYLVPLCLVVAGLWDGREIVVIFWMECIIIFFYSIYRLFKMIGENIWAELFATLFWCVTLVCLWGLFGSMLYQDLFLPQGPREATRMSEDIGSLLEYTLANYGWVVVIVLFVIHGAEEVKRYKWSDGYRDLPLDLGKDTITYLLSLFVFTMFVYPAAVIFGPDSAAVIIVLVIARMFIAYRLSDMSPSSSDLPQEKG